MNNFTLWTWPLQNWPPNRVLNMEFYLSSCTGWYGAPHLLRPRYTNRCSEGRVLTHVIPGTCCQRKLACPRSCPLPLSSYIMISQSLCHNYRPLWGALSPPELSSESVMRSLGKAPPFSFSLGPVRLPCSLQSPAAERTPKELLASKSPLHSQFLKEPDVWHSHCPRFIVTCCCWSYPPYKKKKISQTFKGAEIKFLVDYGQQNPLNQAFSSFMFLLLNLK